MYKIEIFDLLNDKPEKEQFKSLIITIITPRYGIKEKQILDE